MDSIWKDFRVVGISELDFRSYSYSLILIARDGESFNVMCHPDDMPEAGEILQVPYYWQNSPVLNFSIFKFSNPQPIIAPPPGMLEAFWDDEPEIKISSNLENS